MVKMMNKWKKDYGSDRAADHDGEDDDDDDDDDDNDDAVVDDGDDDKTKGL